MNRLSQLVAARQRSATARGGYTLLELLIASVLIATLMAAAWNLMSMYGSFLVAGRTQAAEQQLSRSLMDLVTSDLRAVVPTRIEHSVLAQPASSQHDAATGSSSLSPSGTRRSPFNLESSESAISEPSLQDSLTAGAAQLPEIPFTGDDRSLTLIGVRREPDFDSLQSADMDDRALPATDGFDAGAGSAGLPGRAAAAGWTQVIYQFVPPRAERDDDRELAPGLHRFEFPIEYRGLLTQTGERSADRNADFGGAAVDLLDESPTDIAGAIEQLRAQGITAATHEHIPEVVACRFEFFTEATWQLHWQATPQRDRPVAVRVTLRLLSSTEQRELDALLGSDATDQTPALDAPLAGSSTPAGNNGDPFATFHPRRYERTILMEPARDIHAPQQTAAPGAGPSVVSSRLPAGGR